jgi:hypothetical protein
MVTKRLIVGYRFVRASGGNFATKIVRLCGAPDVAEMELAARWP